MTRRSEKNRRRTDGRWEGRFNYDFAAMKERDEYSRSWTAALRMPYGKERRGVLMNLLSVPGESLHVNRRYCPNLKYDVDLAKLLKSGKLSRTREGSFSTKHTVLRIA